jgi:hypothetical protein
LSSLARRSTGQVVASSWQGSEKGMETMTDPEFFVDLQAKSIKHLPTDAAWRWRAVECTINTAGKVRFEFNLESTDSGTLSQAVWRYLDQRAYQAVQQWLRQGPKIYD